MSKFFRHLAVRCAGRAVPNWVAWVVFPLLALLGVITFFVLNNEWCLSLLVFLLGVVPNFLHQWVCNWQKDRLKNAKTFFANHDLTRGVGQAIRLVLLDAAEERAGDALPGVQNKDARAWLKQHAHEAPAAWQTVVDNEAGTPDSEYAALFEDQLWRFIERRDKQPGEDWAWVQFLRWLNKGNSLPFETDTAAVDAIVRRLNARFGEALWEFTKNAYASNDPAAEAMHLLIAGELLKRTSALAEGVEALKSGLAALQAEWSAHKQAVENKLNALSSKQDWTIRMLRGQYEILSRIEKLLHDTHAPKLSLPPALDAKTRAARAAAVAAGQSDPDRFKAKHEYLAVVGRDEELAELGRWLADDRPFLWDLWTAPAGSGKTRLALELCRRHPAWKRGFFEWTADNKPDWTLWTPHTDTLVIFDYVAERAKEIGDAVASVFARLDAASTHPLPPGVKVRFLLLERTALRAARDDDAANAAAARTATADRYGPAASAKLEAPWLGALRAAATRVTADVKTVYARGDLTSPGRYLGGVSREAAAEIIMADHASARDDAGIPLPQITEAELVQRGVFAERIDSHLRPLFVAMAAEAVREKGGAFDDFADDGGIDALVEHIRDKEWKHARARLKDTGKIPDSEHDAWARLLCLATMCNGLFDPSVVQQRQKLTEALGMSATLKVPDADAYGDGSPYACLVSGANQHEAPKLEPDVLGEAFVLWWLDTHTRQARALLDAAWKLGMTDFVRRAAENFPAKVEGIGLLEPVPGADPASLAAAHTALAVREYTTGDIPALKARGRRLVTARAATGDAFLHPPRVRALGVFMWMQGTATAEELAELDACIASLVDAAKADRAASAELAKGLFNAIAHASADYTRADGLLARLQVLADAHPADAAVREPLAKGLFNAFNNAPANRMRAFRLLARLNRLADAHPADAAVREQLASGLFNAIFHAGADPARADGLLARLQALANAHPADAAVREQLASGLFNAIFHAGADPARADGLLARLQALANAHPADAAVQATALRGCVAAYLRSTQNPPLAIHALERAAALMLRVPTDDQTRTLAVAILHEAAQAIISAAGEELARLERAGAALWAAYQARFGSAT